MRKTFLPGLLRRLVPSDRLLFEAHLLRLDVTSRRNRFGGAVSETFLRDYAARAFELEGVMLGYFVSGELRAAAELRVLTDDIEREAEAAFSVEPDWRRQGVASALFSRLLDAARNRRVRKILVICLPDNSGMQALARKFDGEILRLAPDVLGVVEAPRATFLSRWREATDEAISFATAVFDTQRALAGLPPLPDAWRPRRPASAAERERRA